METKNYLDTVLNSAKTDIFSKLYPEINNYLFKQGKSQPSRYGQTKEVMDFKTQITNPIARCVGGYNRDANIFFLLAEAIWIFAGRKDVAFLEIFNSKMKEFSDDGEVFHAPYGFRLRHWGISSKEKGNEEAKHHLQGFDQIREAIKILNSDDETRRVVLSIWNPDLDLGKQGVDTPCNDLLMYKIRDGKLISTISNRSNDLHWGLPTNVFQFSFLSEVIAKILGVKLGTQTHNSQSLHFYTQNEIAQEMYLSYDRQEKKNDLYDLYEYCRPSEMDFNFTADLTVEGKLALIDYHFSMMIRMLTDINQGNKIEGDKELQNFSKYFHNVFMILRAYILYKKGIESDKSEVSREGFRQLAFASINASCPNDINQDYKLLALNWLFKRIKDTESSIKVISTSTNVKRHLGRY